MPELPEVESVRRTLAPRIEGRTVSRVRIVLPKLARPSPQELSRGIRGKKVQKISRHGKLLILELDGGGFWTIHLGMTGQVILAQKRPQADHIHVTISFADGGERLYYRDLRQFGGMNYCPDRESLAAGPLANFGPDAMEITPREFCDRLAGRTAPLKSLLLDQRILAGVGNIYADEALHRAGLHPLARPKDLSDKRLQGLLAEVKETMAEALARGGSSVKNFVDARGRAGTFQHAHRVYRRTGQPCPACEAPIEKIVVAGRGTHFCPDCQGK